VARTLVAREPRNTRETGSRLLFASQKLASQWTHDSSQPRPVCQASRYTRAPTRWTRISRWGQRSLPRGPHPLCLAMDDGALLLNTACSPVSTRHDSTVYLFASRQKSPTNNLLGQRISHTVLSEFPDASLRTYPRLATREQGHARPGKATCSVEHNALGQFMASRIRRSARSPSLPAT